MFVACAVACAVARPFDGPVAAAQSTMAAVAVTTATVAYPAVVMCTTARVGGPTSLTPVQEIRQARAREEMQGDL